MGIFKKGTLTHPRARKWYERLSVILLLGGALFLRVYKIQSFPPGLHYDEAIDLWAGLRVLSGDFMLYVERGWGREALYYYPLALALSVVSNNWIAFKLTAMVCSLGGMVICYGLVRRKTNFVVAWFTVAWYAVVFWSIFLGRSGNRAIILPLMLNLTILAFWWAWDTSPEDNASMQRKLWRYAVAGLCFGLTMYTYQPARFIPFLFLAFFAYTALFHRERFKQNWQGFVLFAAITALVATPLAYFLLTNPAPESARDWTIAPYLQMMAGNFAPVWENIVATAKMFTIKGDPLVSYNVPGRPVFVPAWTGIFFYAGFALALWRWRQPFYAFVLLWLGVMLAPTILTISAPNHLRASAALPPIAFLAALSIGEGVTWLWQRRTLRQGRQYAVLASLIGVGIVVWVGWAAWHDYTTVWPQVKQDDWERNYNVHINAIVNTVQDDASSLPAVISSHSIEDAHPTIVGVTLERDDVPLYWVDTTQALVMPAGYEEARLFVTTRRWIDSDLSAYIGLSEMPATYEPYFSLIELRFPTWDTDASPVYVIPTGAAFPMDLQTATWPTLPADFDGKVQLVAVKDLPTSLPAGQPITFFTAWEVLQSDKGRALAMFVHVLNNSGELVAQQDGLGYPLVSWRPGDRFLHVHHIATDANLPEGEYWLQIGIYERSDGRRWQIRDGDSVGDRLIVGSLHLTRE